jgi:chlorinating enzyme
MKTEVESRLSPEQVRNFRDHGYIIYDQPVFSEARFAALKDHFEDKLAVLPPDVRPELMDALHFTDPKLFDWLLADEVLDLVEPILGPDIALFNSHFICKPKGNGKRVPWHEDAYYWGKAIDPMQVVTIWLAIDPSTTENGCMRVIPGTRLNGQYDYRPVEDNSQNVFHIEIKPHQIDESKAINLVLQPNQASLHESRLMHSSLPNTSQSRRCGYSMRYISTRSKFTVERPEMHHLYLARGRDHAGNDYGDPSKVYEELRRYRELEVRHGH